MLKNCPKSPPLSKVAPVDGTIFIYSFNFHLPNNTNFFSVGLIFLPINHIGQFGKYGTLLSVILCLVVLTIMSYTFLPQHRPIPAAISFPCCEHHCSDTDLLCVIFFSDSLHVLFILKIVHYWFGFAPMPAQYFFFSLLCAAIQSL